jgi:hypothetical protein
MLPINDALDAFLLGCFLFGLLFAVGSLVLGAADIGGHGHGGDAGGADASADAGNGGHHDQGIGPLNVSTVLGFIAWFGGVGYLARNAAGWAAPVAVFVGLAGGAAGAYLIQLLLRKVIAPADTAMNPHDYELPGTLARVTSSIREGGTGEIVYEQAGYRQVSAARAIDGKGIPRATEVVILSVNAGIAYVQPWNELMGETDDAAALERMEQQLVALDEVEASPPNSPVPAVERPTAPTSADDDATTPS